MPKPYSTDLRERAVEAVESGASRREAAEIFKVGVSSVIRWCRSWSETGSAAPKQSGGGGFPLEEHSGWVFALIVQQTEFRHSCRGARAAPGRGVTPPLAARARCLRCFAIT